MKILTNFTMSAAMLLLLPAALWAEEKRVLWKYQNDEGSGDFKATGPKTWMEFQPKGGVCTFKETDRNAEYIEIYDSTRGQVWVRMYPTQSFWKHPELTRGEWRVLWKGSWAEPSLRPVPKARQVAKEDPAQLKLNGIWKRTGFLSKDGKSLPWDADKIGVEIYEFKDGTCTVIHYDPPKKDGKLEEDFRERSTYKVFSATNPHGIDFVFSEGKHKGTTQRGLIKINEDVMTLTLAARNKERPKNLTRPGVAEDTILLKRIK